MQTDPIRAALRRALDDTVREVEHKSHAEVLRDLARMLGISIPQLARMAGITFLRTERILTRKCRPRPGEIEAIAEALGVGEMAASAGEENNQ